MKISVTVKPRAKEDKVEEMKTGEYRVSVTEPPIQGRANEAVCRLLAAYFGVPRREVVILKGHTARTKLVHVGSSGNV